MGRLTIGLAFLAVLVLSSAAQAAPVTKTVYLVSDAAAPGDLNPPDDWHNDDEYVTWLETLSWTVGADTWSVTVDTRGMSQTMREGNIDANHKGYAADADLIIVTSRCNSGQYDADRKWWNEVATPLILNTGYIVRGEDSSKRWGWEYEDATGATLSETDMDIKLNMGDHDFVSLIHDIGDPAAMFDWDDPSTGDVETEAPKAMTLPRKTATWDANTVIIGDFDTDEQPMLVDVPAGTNLDTLNGTANKYGTTTADRALFGHWGYDCAADGSGWESDYWDWEDFITQDYKDTLENIVATKLGVPEPATLTLMGLGLAGLLVRRRR